MAREHAPHVFRWRGWKTSIHFTGPPFISGLARSDFFPSQAQLRHFPVLFPVLFLSARLFLLLFCCLLQKAAPSGTPTFSAHPARFSPDDKFSKHRIMLKKRFGILRSVVREGCGGGTDSR